MTYFINITNIIEKIFVEIQFWKDPEWLYKEYFLNARVMKKNSYK
jgi:hypothetical protein